LNANAGTLDVEAQKKKQGSTESLGISWGLVFFVLCFLICWV
jgi:hypothetical protein